MKRSKAYQQALEKIEEDKIYSPMGAIKIVKDTVSTKFDPTVDVSMRMGVDPRKADQMVRGTVNLPHGTGKTSRVLVFAGGEKADEAREAGADFVGADDMLEKVKGGWTDFDAVVATPDMMGKVGTLGKVLGPRGLMPNPKTGTVTMDVAKAVGDIKGGKIEFRLVRCQGALHQEGDAVLHDGPGNPDRSRQERGRRLLNDNPSAEYCTSTAWFAWRRRCDQLIGVHGDDVGRLRLESRSY